MAQTPSRVRLTLPAQLLLEVAGSGVQQKVADIELPIVVLVGTDENGTAPTIQVAPIQDTPLSGNVISAADLAAKLPPRVDEQPPKEEGVLGHEPDVGFWGPAGRDARCPNNRMHSAHTWGQIEGSPTAEQIMARQVKVTHYHCPGA